MQTEQILERETYSVGGKPSVHSFKLREHLAHGDSLKVGLQNWFTTAMMRGACRVQPPMPDYLTPRDGQYRQMEKELHANAPKDKHAMVLATMPFLGGFMGRGIDFQKEIRAYERIEYPSYFLQPFHSIPGGWLNPMAMTGHRAAISALYRKAHRRGGEGLREDVAALVPRDAEVVYDFGCSTSDQASFFLDRLGPDARVHCVEASPYGHIVGRHLNADPRIEWHLTMIENAEFEANSADVVNIMFVLHECPNHAKRAILEAAYKVLKPGGRLIVTEPPPEDLEERSRGFFEPYRHEWMVWDVDRELSEVGFTNLESHQILPPVYTIHRVAHKPAVGLA